MAYNHTPTPSKILDVKIATSSLRDLKAITMVFLLLEEEEEDSNFLNNEEVIIFEDTIELL